MYYALTDLRAYSTNSFLLPLWIIFSDDVDVEVRTDALLDDFVAIALSLSLFLI